MNAPSAVPSEGALAERTWRRFGQAPATLGLSPGAREQWHRGRARYAVWLVRARQPAVTARWRDALAALQALDGDHRVAPMPEADLHVTAWVAGFPIARSTGGPDALDDDISESDLAAQARALRQVPGPLRLQLGGANAFLTCAFLVIQDPHGDLASARAALSAASARPELRFTPYLPHVTVARFPTTRPTGPLARALAPLRSLPPIPLRCDALELVTFDARVPDSPLETRWSIPLSPRGGPP